jgi:two-component system phosphate regulon response regulator OmpR
VFPTYFAGVICCYKLFPVSSEPLGGRAETSRLLIVDDDRETLDLLSLYLTEQGFAVSCVENGVAMDAWLATNTADLVILDLMLPGEDGLSIARRLRSDYNLPIVMISARGEDLDRIVGLEVGADDYLPKPFNPRELLARIRAVLRRSFPSPEAAPESANELTFAAFRFEPDKRALYRDGSEVKLSRAEFELLSVFVSHPNQVLSRDQIMDNLSARERDPFDRSIDVRVTRLRHKIEKDPAEPTLIRTVWGVGYQFTPGE